MSVLRLGLFEAGLPPVLRRKLRRARSERAFAAIADAILRYPQQFVLPQLVGPADARRMVRERYWRCVRTLVPAPQLRRALIAELRALGGSAIGTTSAGGEEIAIAGASVDGCPWWLPDFVCNLMGSGGSSGGSSDGGTPDGGDEPPDDGDGGTDPDDGDTCPKCIQCSPYPPRPGTEFNCWEIPCKGDEGLDIPDECKSPST